MSVQGFAGWLGALMLPAVFATFLLKQVSRDYVKRLPAEYADFTDAYRRFMRRMVRRHRYFGLAALAVAAVHGVLAVVRSGLSLSGLASALFLLAAAGLGAYGFYGKKSLRTGWLSAHRALSFLLLLGVIVHIFYKGTCSPG